MKTKTYPTSPESSNRMLGKLKTYNKNNAKFNQLNWKTRNDLKCLQTNFEQMT